MLISTRHRSTQFEMVRLEFHFFSYRGLQQCLFLMVTNVQNINHGISFAGKKFTFMDWRLCKSRSTVYTESTTLFTSEEVQISSVRRINAQQEIQTFTNFTKVSDDDYRHHFEFNRLCHYLLALISLLTEKSNGVQL